MLKFIHLERNRWLKIKPEEVDGKYFKHELDDKGREYNGKVERWHEIVISEELPR